MVPFRSDANPGYRGGARVKPLKKNDGYNKGDRRIKGGIQNAATKGPERKATSRGLTGTSGPLRPIIDAFRGGDTRNIHSGDVW